MSHPTPPSPPPVKPVLEVWRLAWPTVLTMTSYTVMQFIDKLMVAQVGPLEVAAQGNGGIWSFQPIAFAMGVLTVVNTYVAQNLGAGRPKQGPKYAWAGIWLSVMMWLFVLLPWALVLPWFFALTDHSPELQRLEVGYGRILLAGSVLLIAGRGLHHFFFGLHRPKVVTAAAIVGNIANVFFNWVFIFGHLGMPEMGLYGAALGTVLGTAVELLIPAYVFLSPALNRELKSRAAWRPSWKPMRDLLKLGWPASVQFGNEITCWAIFMTILVGRFGENHMTAGWAALGFMHLSFLPAVGFSVAVSSLVGRYIGGGEPDVAAARARTGLKLTMVYMSVCGLVFLIFRHPLIGLFVSGSETTLEQAAEIIDIGGKLMICAAVFQTIDAIGIIYSGALRGAGDTIWPGVVTMIYSWIFIVLGGWLFVTLLPGLESLGPWIGASVYIILLGLTMGWRFEGGRWRSIKLIEDAEQRAAEVAPVTPTPPAAGAEGAVRDVAEGMSEAYEHESESR